MGKTETEYEVIVIGAGLAGLLTAWYLKEAGKKVLILESGTVASGQTGRTTAKITSQHGLKYDTLIKKIGKERAGLYAGANQKAIDAYEELIQENQIDCEFKRCPAYLYTTAKVNSGLLKREADAAKSLGIPAYFTTETELPFAVEGAVCFEDQARFLPLEFVGALAEGLEIRENCQVIGIKGNRVITREGMLEAEKIVVAAHYPFRNLPGFYFLRQHQERSYVLKLSGCPEYTGMYLGIDQDGLSLRQAGDFLLLGGGSHRTGENQEGGKYTFLETAVKKYFPEARIEDRWSAQDCMPHDGIPFIGQFSYFTPNLYVITGFQKWGMTSSMVAAQLIRDAICGRENPYAKVFTPQRCHIRAGMENFLADAGVSVKGLAGGMFTKRHRCTHMGCKLTRNRDEQSWDCPCHGSRFDSKGKLLDNPAIKNRD
ncbi:MAG: FAD-dependent oxidoreductase [Lachnospiraceae bacterium]|nr:FAD-dependent oxidoreductase [Lachnospiraceae bacterium]